ncbi:hypothetical protein KB553_20415 [Chryseobacterium rhizoplanae]|uniref:hypothetical protein n=1 Tax=Chryseobacterium rhizoplanae TaxID=1609531 RepID=UPI001CE29467|nr:hypothetical protein [Chryseobacterium rhizoplanae]UCA59358.1 hypothetical protein KB553_20415 [Chryseobacterium rhizoplanae]
MNKIKIAYYYFFYKIYKSIVYTSQLVGGEFWSDFKAGIAVAALEIWFLGSLLNYYSLIKNVKLNFTLKDPIILIPLVLLFLLNYFAFIHNEEWKEYNKKFDMLSQKTNKKGTVIVCIIVGFVIINFLGSSYLLQKYIFKMY